MKSKSKACRQLTLNELFTQRASQVSESHDSTGGTRLRAPDRPRGRSNRTNRRKKTLPDRGHLKQTTLVDYWASLTTLSGVQTPHGGSVIEVDMLVVWPTAIVQFTDSTLNPAKLTFETLDLPEACDCVAECLFTECQNALAYVFCTESCSRKEQCGNKLMTDSRLQLSLEGSVSGIGVVATADIQPGIILGEYVGQLRLCEPEKLNAMRRNNKGYLFEMRAKACQDRRSTVFVDAEKFGNITRFMNHSCDATATFEEMSNGSRRAVVVVSQRTILAGQQVTVDYGSDLWFDCNCGASTCRRPSFL